jgi:hypothetical protein
MSTLTCPVQEVFEFCMTFYTGYWKVNVNLYIIKPLEPRFERLLKSLIRCEPTNSRRFISLHMAKFEDPYFRNHEILIKYPDEEIEENYFKKFIYQFHEKPPNKTACSKALQWLHMTPKCLFTNCMWWSVVHILIDLEQNSKKALII